MPIQGPFLGVFLRAALTFLGQMSQEACDGEKNRGRIRPIDWRRGGWELRRGIGVGHAICTLS